MALMIDRSKPKRRGC